MNPCAPAMVSSPEPVFGLDTLSAFPCVPHGRYDGERAQKQKGPEAAKPLRIELFWGSK
jgi:hypothetical protein